MKGMWNTAEERLSECKEKTPEDQRLKRGEFCHLKWKKQKPVGRNWVAPVERGWRCEEENKMKVNVREDKRCVRQTDVASGRGELKTCKAARKDSTATWWVGSGEGMTCTVSRRARKGQENILNPLLRVVPLTHPSLLYFIIRYFNPQLRTG